MILGTNYETWKFIEIWCFEVVTSFAINLFIKISFKFAKIHFSTLKFVSEPKKATKENFLSQGT